MSRAAAPGGDAAHAAPDGTGTTHRAVSAWQAEAVPEPTDAGDETETRVPPPVSEARRDVLYALRRRGDARVDDVAEALMARAAEEVAAKQCRDVIAAIRVPTVLQGLRVACVKAKIPEEAVTYMVEVDQLMQAAEAISPTSAACMS